MIDSLCCESYDLIVMLISLCDIRNIMKISHIMVLLPFLLIMIVPVVYDETVYAETVNGPIIIPTSFQELSGITAGGTWSATVTNNVTSIQVSQVTNNNLFDITNLQSVMNLYKNGEKFCTIPNTISSLTAGSTEKIVWSCPDMGIADEAKGGLINYDLATKISTNNSNTNSTSQDTSNDTTSNSTGVNSTTPTNDTITPTKTSKSRSTTPSNTVTTSFVIDNHSMSIIISDYQGTKKLLTFTGSNFTTSETIDIDVMDSIGTKIVDIQTAVQGSGDFKVPAIVDISTLSNENYTTIVKGTTANLEFVIVWNGSTFTFTNQITPSTSTDTSGSTTPSTSTTISTSTDMTNLKKSLAAQIASLRSLIDALEAQIAMIN